MRKTLQQNLKKLRLEYNYKQAYVAMYLGVSQATYCRIERDASSTLTVQTIEKLAKLYDITPNRLLDDMEGEIFRK